MHRSKGFVTGLVIAGLLGLGDIITLLVGNGETPPVEVAAIGAALGLITVAALVPAWRGSRGGVIAIVVSRLLSAVTALPAFFVDDVPGGAVAAAAVGLVITLVAVALVAARLRRPAAVPA
ncbi:hypothetical protein ACQP2Y_19680 [Actinoplanes sp. CA-051413]|jgi:hypothetical protein|uniref:hypothetical protein n=1 Tax=Actinoplanes sp. CA-051413 TaxID=3239899 RepID=UPI003D960273